MGNQDKSKVSVLCHVCCHGLCNTPSERKQAEYEEVFPYPRFVPRVIMHSSGASPKDMHISFHSI